MKKVVLLAGCLSLLVAGIVSVSCSKKEEAKPFNGCTCTISATGGYSETMTVTAEEAKAEGYNSCSGVEAGVKKVAEGEGAVGVTVSCKDK